MKYIILISIVFFLGCETHQQRKVRITKENVVKDANIKASIKTICKESHYNKAMAEYTLCRMRWIREVCLERTMKSCNFCNHE